MNVNLIHIHEDDWQMCNIYPISALDEAVADIDDARQNSDQSFASFGWTDIHMISQPTASYLGSRLTKERFRQALVSLMPEVDRFYATSGAGFGKTSRESFGVYDDAPLCFGFGPQCFIKAETTSGALSHIWFAAFPATTRDQATALWNAFLALDAIEPSLIADYVQSEAGRIADRAFLDIYMQSKCRSLQGEGC